MAENVIILGAGASLSSGAPLMNDFLDRADHLRNQNLFGEYEDEINFVFDAFAEVYKVFAKSTLDIRNIEAFFGTVEMAKIIGRLGNYSNNEIDQIYTGLIRLIVMTLENTSSFYVNQDIDDLPENRKGRYTDSGYYRELTETIIRIGAENCAIITFNYDLLLDYELSNIINNINYCLEVDKENGIKLLKLHGSLNWGICSKCNKIIPYQLNNYFLKHNFHVLDRHSALQIRMFLNQNQTLGKLLFTNKLNDLKQIHKHPKSNYNFSHAIIPPTWTKNQYHGTLTNVWKAAATELSTAKNIYIIGYSLPESDSFFKYLYALGSISSSRIERFWVFNPDCNINTYNRYRQIIGDTVKDRFLYIPKDFSYGTRLSYQRESVNYYEDGIELLNS